MRSLDLGQHCALPSALRGFVLVMSWLHEESPITLGSAASRTQWLCALLTC